jgi:predicted TIM-barrel fold metal-dependent hydrolase
MVSNGEYMPFPQTQKQKQVEQRIQDLAEKVCKKVGISRRQFLGGSGGMAAAFLAMNDVYGQKFFKVDEEEMFDSEASEEQGPPDDLFVFDDQTHTVRNPMDAGRALRAIAQGPGRASANAHLVPGGYQVNPYNGIGGNAYGPDELGNLWTPWNPASLLHPEPLTALLHADYPPNTGDEFHMTKYIQRFFFESQTSVTILSNANIAVIADPGTGGTRPARNIAESLRAESLTGSQTRAICDWVNEIAGSRRMLAHGQVYPGVGNLRDPIFGDYTQWQIENVKPDSWKAYNIANAAKTDYDPNSNMTVWRLDDEAVAYPIYRVIANNHHMLQEHPGFFNICVHKGLAASSPQDPQHGMPTDLPKAATDWPQFNFIIYHSCIRPSFYMLRSLNDIRGGRVRTDTRGHTVPNIEWSTQFAQICAGRDAMSPRRLPNVYAELGTTFASMVVTFPTVLAHLMGQLLYYVGADHIVFGSDSLWYGGPQWQIEALWRFQIPEEIGERWDYPEITERDKRKILGLNSARLYGLQGREVRAVGQRGSAYNPLPADYASRIPDSLTQLLNSRDGYSLTMNLPNDNFTKARKQYAEMRGLRSNERSGWIRTRI